MAWQFISKEQQKKTPIQWGQFIPKWTVNVPIREVTPNLWPLAPVAVGAWALAWSYVAGKALEWVGKAVYWATLPPPIDEAKAIQSYKAGVTNIKPRVATDVLLDTPIIQKTPLKQIMRSPTSPLWWIGTRSMIWTQAERMANQIYKKTINPVFTELDKAWIKLDTPSLVQSAKDSILKSKKYSPSQIQEIIENIDDMAKNYKPSLSVKELDLEKQAIAGKIPQKYQTMPKLPNEAKAAQKELAWTFRKAIHKTIKKMSWVDSAKLYQDYASLKWVSQIWPKSISQSGLAKWFWWFRSTIAQELVTPVTTTTWKLTYKAWKALQYLPKKIVETIKNTPNALKWMWLKDIAKVAIKEMPAWIIAEQFWKTVSDTTMSNSILKKDLEQAIKALKEWKKIPTTSFLSKRETKWLDTETSITVLEKALSKYK